MSVTKELSRLYREYYANRMSHADYRYQRGLLLDSLLADDPDSAEDATVSRAEAAAAELAPEPPPEPEAPKEPRATRWPAFAAGIVVLFGGTLYVTMTQLDDPVTSAPPSGVSGPAPGIMAPAVGPQAAPDVHREPDVGQPLVEAFLQADSWEARNLERFLEAWGSLPAQDRIVAKGAVWFAPLADRLEYEIGEAEEFSDEPDSDVYLQQLYLMALGLGLTELAPDDWKPGLADRSISRPPPVPEEATVETAAAGNSAEEGAAEERVAEESAAEGSAAEGSAAEESAVEESAAGERVAEESAAEERVAAENVSEGIEATAFEEASASVPDEPAADRVEAGEPVDVAPASGDADPGTASAGNENACNESQLQTRRRGCFDVLASGGQGPAMRVIGAGSVADVEVASPFAISAFEVSRADFTAFCERTGADCPENPWPGENMPVVNVSWHDAVAYCNWLSDETGFRYRLPTAAEWEYAARAGTASDYPFGNEITAGQARYSSITEYDKPLSVDDRTTQRNDFGLWHVVGNVREWVAGAADGDAASTRGGSYADDADGLRLSSRHTMPATARDRMTGFRVVREL